MEKPMRFSGILKHLETSLDIAPCIIYNVPTRTAQDISPNIIEKIALHPNFIGVNHALDQRELITMKNNPLPVGLESFFESRHLKNSQRDYLFYFHFCVNLYVELVKFFSDRIFMVF